MKHLGDEDYFDVMSQEPEAETYIDMVLDGSGSIDYLDSTWREAKPEDGFDVMIREAEAGEYHNWAVLIRESMRRGEERWWKWV